MTLLEVQGYMHYNALSDQKLKEILRSEVFGSTPLASEMRAMTVKKYLTPTERRKIIEYLISEDWVKERKKFNNTQRSLPF
jgi:hypothetical protein